MARPAAAEAAKSPRLMTDEHKAALAEGREQGRIVRRYLEAVADRHGPDIEDFEAAFIAVAGPYSARKGLTYAAWRAVGVAPRVLRAAGIPRRQ
ncbi:MAG TPA: hypothetical protein VE760_01715 [Acidimicrobiales bacterium]|nr:hypothetical protein [Acidimicrobiales bacterium]